MQLKGFGVKAANLLARLVRGNAMLLAVLRSLLQPADIAAIVITAARGFKAGDVEVESMHNYYYSQIWSVELKGRLMLYASEYQSEREKATNVSVNSGFPSPVHLCFCTQCMPAKANSLAIERLGKDV